MVDSFNFASFCLSSSKVLLKSSRSIGNDLISWAHASVKSTFFSLPLSSDPRDPVKVGQKLSRRRVVLRAPFGRHLLPLKHFGSLADDRDEALFIRLVGSLQDDLASL